MNTTIPTRLETRRADSIARRFTIAACDERRDEADALMDQGVRFFRACRDAGLPAAYLSDAAKGFRDEMSNLVAGIDRDLDDVNALSDERVDFSELDELIGGLS